MLAPSQSRFFTAGEDQSARNTHRRKPIKYNIMRCVHITLYAKVMLRYNLLKRLEISPGNGHAILSKTSKSTCSTHSTENPEFSDIFRFKIKY